METPARRERAGLLHGDLVIGGVVGGDSPDKEVYGTACLQADGSWLVQ